MKGDDGDWGCLVIVTSLNLIVVVTIITTNAMRVTMRM